MISYQTKSNDWNSCANTASAPQSGSQLPKGAKLTQAGAVGYTTDFSDTQWGGIPVRMTTGTFVVGPEITVSLPSENVPSYLNNYESLSGSLTWGSPALSQDWNAVRVTQGTCTGVTDLSFDYQVSGSDGTVSGWVDESGGLGGLWVNSVGSSCDNPTIAITATCDQGTDADCCSALPTATVRCNTRIEGMQCREEWRTFSCSHLAYSFTHRPHPFPTIHATTPALCFSTSSSISTTTHPTSSLQRSRIPCWSSCPPPHPQSSRNHPDGTTTRSPSFAPLCRAPPSPSAPPGGLTTKLAPAFPSQRRQSSLTRTRPSCSRTMWFLD